MFTEINGNRLNYTAYGQGPPVVLVHGLGGVGNAWYGVGQVLKQHHYVVAPDLRGHGRSAGKDTFSIQRWSDDIRGLIDHLELSAVTLVGHSLGTLVVQHLAEAAPDLCDQLVLVGGISYFDPETCASYRERAELVEQEGLEPLVDDWLAGAISAQTHATMPGAVALLREMFLRNDPTMYAKSCRALADTPSIRRENVGQPTLIVLGAHDRSTPLGMAEELKREIPVSRVQVIAHAAHWVLIEDPGQLAATILEFLT